MYQDRKRGLDLVRGRKNLGARARARAVCLDLNQNQGPDPEYDRNQDPSHTTEATPETVIVEGITLHRSHYPNLDPEVNLNLDLGLDLDLDLDQDQDQDQDQEASPDAKDHAALKIRCQHYQGMVYDSANIMFSFYSFYFHCDIRYYGRRGKSSSLELELSDSEEKVLSTAQKPTVMNTTNT